MKVRVKVEKGQCLSGMKSHNIHVADDHGKKIIHRSLETRKARQEKKASGERNRADQSRKTNNTPPQVLANGAVV